MINAPFFLKKHNFIKNSLCPIDDEGRDKDFALLTNCILENFPKFISAFKIGLMQAISVGGFYNHIVRSLNVCGIPLHDGILRPKISGKNNFYFLPIFLKPYLKICASQNMPCITASDLDSRSYFENIVITYRMEKRTSMLHILFGIERFHR